MNKKSGFSMLALAITIVVVIILTSTIAISMDQLSNRHKLSIFINNVTTMEEYIESLNILKEEMPFEVELTIDEVKSKINSANITTFNNELINNGDSSTLSFKKIDLSKMEIDEKYTGYAQEGADDIYVYSENTGIVYYLKGIKIDGELYFSKNDKIMNRVQ